MSIKTSFKSQKSSILSYMISVMLLLLSIHFFLVSIPPLIHNIGTIQKKQFLSVAKELRSNDLISNFVVGNSINQKFIAQSGQIHEIGVKIATYKNENIDCTLQLSLLKNEEPIEDITKSCSEIKDNEMLFFPLSEPLVVKSGEEYSLFLTTDGSENNKLAIYTFSDGKSPLLVNGSDWPGSITFLAGNESITTTTYKNTFMLLMLITTVVLAFILVIWLLRSHFLL